MINMDVIICFAFLQVQAWANLALWFICMESWLEKVRWKRAWCKEILSLTRPWCYWRINMIEDQGNVILLLDALDEECWGNEQLWCLLENVIKFYKGLQWVGITCRTQFFSSFDEEPKLYRDSKLFFQELNFIGIIFSPFTKEEGLVT